jgi:hypothetical protein
MHDLSWLPTTQGKSNRTVPQPNATIIVRSTKYCSRKSDRFCRKFNSLRLPHLPTRIPF